MVVRNRCMPLGETSCSSLEAALSSPAERRLACLSRGDIRDQYKIYKQSKVDKDVYQLAQHTVQKLHMRSLQLKANGQVLRAGFIPLQKFPEGLSPMAVFGFFLGSEFSKGVSQGGEIE